ncbi:hypothetical protein KOR42_20490 [Thalassoglobus neptunius]|uniref:Uncharacterized protein n=1 Tax=Thalassoglobus neptunius TaxID=1938619 RepID=A0A5C5X6C5_9PLAN|nr:hypothetical protein [Thalassoglobus neptunius]TWT58667.1 hypothetical protein KOR42_20490 [Thalassoglobus neptunius]
MADTDQQTIEELQSRYQVLHEKKIATQTNLTNAQSELQKLKKEALEKYGTDDLEELRSKLEELTAENERKRRDYQTLLEGIETDLAKVETDSERSLGVSDADASE